MSISILSTKKLESPCKLQLEEDGFLVQEADFIAVESRVSAADFNRIHIIGDNEVVVFTSANAVAIVKQYINTLARLSVFCISGKTKHAVEAGFPNATIKAVAPYGKELAQEIVAAGVKQAVFFCGNIRRKELPQILRQNSIALEEIIVYQTTATPKKIEENFDAVLFFSPSAVSSFFSVNITGTSTIFFCIGETTAEEVKRCTGNKVIASVLPTQESLVEKIYEYYKPG